MHTEGQTANPDKLLISGSNWKGRWCGKPMQPVRPWKELSGNGQPNPPEIVSFVIASEW